MFPTFHTYILYRSVYTRENILDICIPANCILNACPEFFKVICATIPVQAFQTHSYQNTPKAICASLAW